MYMTLPEHSRSVWDCSVCLIEGSSLSHCNLVRLFLFCFFFLPRVHTYTHIESMSTLLLGKESVPKLNPWEHLLHSNFLHLSCIGRELDYASFAFVCVGSYILFALQIVVARRYHNLYSPVFYTLAALRVLAASVITLAYLWGPIPPLPPV